MLVVHSRNIWRSRTESAERWNCWLWPYLNQIIATNLQLKIRCIIRLVENDRLGELICLLFFLYFISSRPSDHKVRLFAIFALISAAVSLNYIKPIWMGSRLKRVMNRLIHQIGGSTDSLSWLRFTSREDVGWDLSLHMTLMRRNVPFHIKHVQLVKEKKREIPSSLVLTPHEGTIHCNSFAWLNILQMTGTPPTSKFLINIKITWGTCWKKYYLDVREQLYVGSHLLGNAVMWSKNSSQLNKPRR